MPSSEPTISYATASASAGSTSLLNDLQKLHIKEGNGDAVAIHKDQVSADAWPSNNPANKAATKLADTKFDVSLRITQIDPPSQIPTSASASEEGDDSPMSLTSQTSPDDVSAHDNKLNNTATKNETASSHPMLSIWTGAASTPKDLDGFSPLASIGSASARPLSPILRTRKSRFSRFFSATQNARDSGSPGSPLFSDGLSGGLISSMSDIKTQQQKMREDVKSYVTSHYASPSQTAGPSRVTGTVPWNQYDTSAKAHVGIMPFATFANSSKPAQIAVTKVGQEARLGLTGNAFSSVYRPDGLSFTASKKNPTATHNPRAAPFIPRHTTTLENLEQAAGEHDEQRSLTITRPQSSWDQVPNWRTGGRGQGRFAGEILCEPAEILTPGETQHVQDMYSPAGVPGRGPMPQGSQPRFNGPLVPSNFPPIFIPSSSQALTISQSSSSSLGAIDKRHTSRTFEPFRPMNAVLNPDAFKQPLSEEDIVFREQNGISLNYHGNHENPRNISAKIPDRENCAIWITNLPANCTHRDLLQALAIHRPGRVWATHINAPAQPKHRHAAAKVVFYHPSEAKRLLELSWQPCGIFVQDRRILAIYNKQRVPAQEFSFPTSRVLEIRGDKAIVNEKFLRSLFESHFRFEDEAVEVLAEFDNVRVIEWRFGSMRAQAGSAYKLLERMYPCVDIRYATDPCAQYIVLPPQEQVKQLVAPAKGGFVPQSSFGAPSGPGKMHYTTNN